MNDNQDYSIIGGTQYQCVKAANCLCWTIQIILWITLLIGLYFSFHGGAIMLYLSFFPYIVYLICEFQSPAFAYIKSYKTPDKISDKLGTLFQTPPSIFFIANSCHLKSKFNFYRDFKGRLVTHITDEMEYSDSDLLNFSYYSAKDVSGLFSLNVQNDFNKNKIFVKLHLKKEINFADAISFYDYITIKRDFRNKNTNKDRYLDFKENRTIDGFQEHNMLLIGDTVPIYYGLGFFILFTILPFCELYKLYMDSCCIEQTFTIRKLVSSRYNLTNQEYVQQYKALQPALDLHSQVIYYDTSKTQWLKSKTNVVQPTAEELEKAQKYIDQIPNYTYTTVKGKDSGIVHDNPKYAETDYNKFY